MFNSSRIKKESRLNKLYKQGLLNTTKVNQSWEINFPEEVLWSGHRVKFIVITDAYNKAVLAIEATKPAMSTEIQLLKMLEHLQNKRSLPSTLIYDHSAFISIGLDKWSRETSVKQIYLYSGVSDKNYHLARLAHKRSSSMILSYNRIRFHFR